MLSSQKFAAASEALESTAASTRVQTGTKQV